MRSSIRAPVAGDFTASKAANFNTRTATQATISNVNANTRVQTKDESVGKNLNTTKIKGTIVILQGE